MKRTVIYLALGAAFLVAMMVTLTRIVFEKSFESTSATSVPTAIQPAGTPFGLDPNFIFSGNIGGPLENPIEVTPTLSGTYCEAIVTASEVSLYETPSTSGAVYKHLRLGDLFAVETAFTDDAGVKWLKIISNYLRPHFSLYLPYAAEEVSPVLGCSLVFAVGE